MDGKGNKDKNTQTAAYKVDDNLLDILTKYDWQQKNTVSVLNIK